MTMTRCLNGGNTCSPFETEGLRSLGGEAGFSISASLDARLSGLWWDCSGFSTGMVIVASVMFEATAGVVIGCAVC